MGVRGLASLIENHGRIYRDVRFRGRRLVIDGSNLIFLLYFSSGLDQNHGGDYAALEGLVETFVAALRACEVTPYVVLDGGSDITDKKLDTVTLRAVDRIRRAHQAAEGGEQLGILPHMTKLVFRQTLIRLKVPVATCYGEADQEIAALAAEWQCPVLSNDSDFYIFDLPGGLLPISHFQWRAVQQRGTQSFISCKSYNNSSFCIFFSLQRPMLPAFAALAGNDYVKLQRMELSVRWPPSSLERDGTASHLEGLLRWLRSFRQPEEALEAALGLMGELSTKKKAEVVQGLSLGMAEYVLPPSSLKMFFIHGVAPPFPANTTSSLLPDWMRLPLTRSLLTADVLDVLLLRRKNLSCPVDHADMPSAQLTSRPLRQVMYGLLLGSGTGLQVQERDREGLQLKSIPVQPACRGVVRQLALNALDTVDPGLRLQVLLDALGVTEASLSPLPPQLRLPVAVTCYWLQRARPPPEEQQLKVLLLGMSTGDARRHRAESRNRNQCFQKPDAVVAHTFNQWQACLNDGIQLNQLLGFPLDDPQVARLYEGTLVHQLVHRMRTGERLKRLPKSDRTTGRLYLTMLAVTQRFHARGGSPVETAEGAAAPRQQPLDDLDVSLQQLFLLYGEDAAAEASSLVRAQQELHLEDSVTVRTRYRTKARKNRCNNPELSRKEDCRGWDLL